jgi:hypothetical protein
VSFLGKKILTDVVKRKRLQRERERVFTVGDLKLLIYATTVETRIVGELGKLFRSF